MRMLRYPFIGLLLCLLAVSSTRAAGPRLLNFQGRLSDSLGQPLVGTYSVQFAIYNAQAAGVQLWVETQSVTTSADGVVAVLLGSVNPLSPSVFNDTLRFLGIKVGPDPELAPRIRLASAPCSFVVHTVDGASGGTVWSALSVIGPVEARSAPFLPAVTGISTSNQGSTNYGIYGIAANSPYQNLGVYGLAYDATAFSNSAAIYGAATSFGGTVWAGYFDGWVNVTGTFYAAAKSFKIDDPADPSNRTLQHACVESDEYKNVYDGVVTTDAEGIATVTLPGWFETLNRDFRYQLTVIGQFAQVIVSREIDDNQFTITSDKPNVKVSWQVTGVRKDPYAAAHPFQVQQLKPLELRGKYLHPAEYGLDDRLGIDYAARQYTAGLKK